MKANELMVGDWVYMKAHRGFDSQYIKVETIPDSSSDTHYGHIGAYPISDDMDFRDIEDSHLAPIPITPEILEKNGFVNDFYEEESVADYVRIEIEGYSLHTTANEWDKALVTYCNGHLDVTTDFSGEVRGEFEYVHELQHALRICGIDKEIML